MVKYWYWYRLLREAVDSPSLAKFKTQLDSPRQATLADRAWAGSLNEAISRYAFQPQEFCDSMGGGGEGGGKERKFFYIYMWAKSPREKWNYFGSDWWNVFIILAMELQIQLWS